MRYIFVFILKLKRAKKKLFVFNIFVPQEATKTMQVNAINNYNINSKNNNITFEGLRIRRFIPQKSTSERFQEVISDTCRKYGKILGIKTAELKEITKNANADRIKFLKTLVTNYNARNFTRLGNLRENPQGVIDTYKVVERPQIAHFNIVENTDAPMEMLSKLFTVARDKKSLEFVQKMEYDVLGSKKTAVKIITDMLASKNRQEYIKNSQNYVSYLKYNAENENAVAELDKMLENGTFDKKVYDAKQAVKRLMKNSAIRETIGNKTEYLEQNYSPDGEKFIGGMFSDFLAHKKGLTPEDFAEILKMYKTSTHENISTRLDVLRKFKYATAGQGANASRSEIKSMKKLFDRMDSDKSSANFVYKILGDDVKAKSIKDLAGILDIVPSKKAEIFHKNIARIVRFTDEEERVSALTKEVENPFFITNKYAQVLEDSINAGFAKKESKIGRVARLLENKINKMRYHKIEGLQTSVSGAELPVAKPVKAQALSNISIETGTPALELKRTFKESPQARKLRVQNDVNEIIKQKLGAKTFERQQEAYKNGALVMRLKLLPEIFESIKATRKAQISAGLRPNVESADAIKLYSKINGKNKKIVNYMLKQTNDKGERIFSVKDIIKHIDKIDKEVALAKIRNPHFKSSELNEIYNDEYIYLQYDFGKLKRSRKVA